MLALVAAIAVTVVPATRPAHAQPAAPAPTPDHGQTRPPDAAVCQPAQVDRPSIAASPPPQYRGTATAASHTWVYTEHHDFGISNVWTSSSPDGGATWNTTPVSAEQIGS